MGSTPWRDREVLYELHTEKRLSQSEIADELGCSRQTIHKWINEYGIEKGEAKYKDEDVLRDMIEMGLTYEEMSEGLDCSAHTVLRWCHKYGLEVGRGAHSYKRRSGRALFTHADVGGYERWTCTMTKDVVKVHRLVAVAEYGFDEVKDKVIHHENDIPWDNRPGNLTPMLDAEHKILHLKKELADDD